MTEDKKKAAADEKLAKDTIKKILDTYNKLTPAELAKIPQLAKIRPQGTAPPAPPPPPKYQVCYPVTYLIGTCDKM